MTHCNSQQINDDRIAQQQRESHQNPGQEGGLEVKKPEEVHADVRVPAAPHVHQHDGESLAQEEEACKEAEECHEKSPEEKHEDKVCSPSPKGAFL